MAIEHVAIQDPQIHEPKGVASANAGEVYIADGAGGGVWALPAPNAYGDMKIRNNTTESIAVPAAVDSTLETNTDYVRVTLAAWYASPLVNMTFSNSSLGITENGRYKLNAWFNIEVPTGGTGNRLIALRFSPDDTQVNLSEGRILQTLDFGGDIQNAAASSIDADLYPAGSDLSIWVASQDSVNLIIRDAGIAVVQIARV